MGIKWRAKIFDTEGTISYVLHKLWCGNRQDVEMDAAVLAVQIEVLHLLPGLGVHDGRVFPLVKLLLVRNLARVQDVGQQMVQAGLAERLAATLVPLARLPALVPPAPSFQLPDRSPLSSASGSLVRLEYSS
jgi:hypothetical protein